MSETPRDEREARSEESTPRVSRRDLLRAGALGAAGLAVVSGARALKQDAPARPGALQAGHDLHGGNMAVGDIKPGLFDPTKYLKDFDYGRVSKLPSGQTLREYDIVAVDQEIEI